MDDNKSQKSHTDDHNQLPSDEVTRNKIDKHLSDESDTISEEDIKNINTGIGKEDITEPDKNADKEFDDALENDKKEEEPEKEAPTPWEILGE